MTDATKQPDPQPSPPADPARGGRTLAASAVLAALYRAARELCPRCAEGHCPHKGMGELLWSHGVDVAEGTTFPPEPCNASAIADLVYRIEWGRLDAAPPLAADGAGHGERRWMLEWRKHDGSWELGEASYKREPCPPSDGTARVVEVLVTALAGGGTTGEDAK